jgi:hypothetical protein
VTTEIGEVTAPAGAVEPSIATTTPSVWAIVPTATALTFMLPTSWIVALAGFLARGGFVLLALPILILPSSADVVTAATPIVSRLLLGTWQVEAAIVAAAIVGIVSVAVVGLLLIGGAADSWIVTAAADELGHGRVGAARPSSSRLAAAWLLGQLPFIAVAAFALGPLYDATYLELTAPGDPAASLSARVLARIPGVAVSVVGVGLVSGMLAAMAVRQVALEGTSLWMAVPAAVRAIARRPIDAIVAMAGSLLAVAFLVSPAVLASSVAFTGLQGLVADGTDGLLLGAAVVLLAASWLGGLLLMGVASAWRSFAWTAVHVAASTRPVRGAAGPSRG